MDPVEIPTGFYWSSTGLLLDPLELPTGFYWYSIGSSRDSYWFLLVFYWSSIGLVLDPVEISTGFYWYSTGIFLMVSTGNHFTFHIQTSRKFPVETSRDSNGFSLLVSTGFSSWD